MSDIDFKHVLPAGWSRAVGFSYAVEARGSRHLSIAGQIARHQGQGNVNGSLSFGQQWDIALGNVVALVQAAGGTAQHITALRIYVTNMEEYYAFEKARAEAWRKHLGKHFPASTLVQVAGLVDLNAMVEIEAEAILP
jgi:enamine deaminase RidA (YjgF/YER057c/UK114 family)